MSNARTTTKNNKQGVEDTSTATRKLTTTSNNIKTMQYLCTIPIQVKHEVAGIRYVRGGQLLYACYPRRDVASCPCPRPVQDEIQHGPWPFLALATGHCRPAGQISLTTTGIAYNEKKHHFQTRLINCDR